MSAAGLQRAWRVAEEDRSNTATLAKGLGVPRIVAHLLMLRGIRTVEEGNTFLNPSLHDLLDPFTLTDMQPAVDRIEHARRNGDPVLVFGDYDVDGIAGTAILINALRRYGIAPCRYGMPSRLLEGYGIAPEHVEAARNDGIRLIITVDNGVNAREAAATARRLGIDLIVTDHHEIEGELPDAVAVINPKREDESCPGRYVSGAAVAFYLARALTHSADDLDLVALGTVADVVPLVAQNRVLVALGLEQMAQRPRVGLRHLAAVAGTNLHEITTEKIAFQLAPRINAAGRLGEGVAPLRLLLTDSETEAAQMAAELDKANEERRSIEKQILEEATEEIEATLRADVRTIVLARRGWHPGVIGVVASRLQSTHNRPVALIALDEDGVGRGSARSADDFDMIAALGACRDHVVRFGGHAAAAGFTILEGNIRVFQTAFEAEAAKRLRTGETRLTIDVDALVSFTEIDGQLVKAIDRLEPFGCMNPSPVFCTYGVTPVPYSVRELRGGHARVRVQQGPRLFEAVGFHMAGLIQQMVGTGPIDIAYTPRLNTWRGETAIQLVLKDVHCA